MASAILTRSVKSIKKDWKERYGDTLYMLDTLVSEDLFDGICYKASGWLLVGKTKGMGYKAFRKDKKGQGASNIEKISFKHGIKKHIFIKPLYKCWRNKLCQM